MEKKEMAAKAYLEQLRKSIDAGREAQIKTLRELIGIESVAEYQEGEMPFGEGVQKAFDYMMALGESMGFTTFRAGGYGGHMLRCLPAQGRAAQVGVQDHAGGVDDTAQRIIIAMPEPFQNLRGKRRGGGDGVSRAGQQGLAEGLGFLLQEFPHEYIGVLLAGPADFGQSQQTFNFWDPAEKSVVHDRVLLLKAL